MAYDAVLEQIELKELAVTDSLKRKWRLALVPVKDVKRFRADLAWIQAL